MRHQHQILSKSVAASNRARACSTVLTLSHFSWLWFFYYYYFIFKAAVDYFQKKTDFRMNQWSYFQRAHEGADSVPFPDLRAWEDVLCYCCLAEAPGLRFQQQQAGVAPLAFLVIYIGVTEPSISFSKTSRAFKVLSLPDCNMKRALAACSLSLCWELATLCAFATATAALLSRSCGAVSGMLCHVLHPCLAQRPESLLCH